MSAPKYPHTSEPWEVHGATLVWAPDAQAVVAQCSELRPSRFVEFKAPATDSPYLGEIAANADRIVACANACAGIPTSALQEGVIAEMKEALVHAHKKALHGEPIDLGKLGLVIAHSEGR